jgi:hypothetical protein
MPDSTIEQYFKREAKQSYIGFGFALIEAANEMANARFKARLKKHSYFWFRIYG